MQHMFHGGHDWHDHCLQTSFLSGNKTKLILWMWKETHRCEWLICTQLCKEVSTWNINYLHYYVHINYCYHICYSLYFLAGIMGKEGRQAVRCSDFAFARFKFLRRILLVHGHWYYIRVATLIQYFFYKNILFITPQLYYAFSNSFSTQVISSSYHLKFW